MKLRSRSTCSRIPIGWSVARPPSRSGKWVMSVAWNPCVMRCATVTGKFGNDEFKDDAVNALVELGEPALSRLIKALKDKDENVRKQAVKALGLIKHANAIDPLIDMLADSDFYIRVMAAAGLEAIGDDRGREAIKPLMKDPDLVVRMRVERILAKWKKQPATETVKSKT